MARTDYGAILSTKIADTSQAIRDVEQTVGLIAPAEWGSRIRAMHSQSDYDNVMAQLVEETTTPASIASFTDGANNIPVKELVCTINPTETGTGTKSPSNPYVIGGHTEINVNACGSNMLNVSDFSVSALLRTVSCANNDFTISFEGTVSISYIVPTSAKSYFPMMKKGTYYFLFKETTSEPRGFQSVRANLELADGTTTSVLSGNFVTVSQDFRISAITCNAIGVSVGTVTFNLYMGQESVTDYEPFNGQTHHADFGQTVYGGELNVTTGVLTITQKYADLGDLNYSKTAYGQNTVFQSLPISDGKVISGATGLSKGLCEEYAIVQNLAVGTSGNDNCMAIGAYWTGGCHAYIVDSSKNSMTANEFKQAVNGYKFTYELATPIEIQLTPTQVNTLLGANNIFHDCNGNIEVEYRANGALYVAQH